MRIERYLLSIVCLLLYAAGTLAANSHWTVNPRAYQYDMTAYVKVASTTGSPLQQSDYEVAAFCGDECRGVGKLLTATDGTAVFQLRIYSNVTADETIYFRVYQKETGMELMPDNQLTFEPLSVAGTPSEPLALMLSIIQKGDVNGDGDVTPQDASLILQIVAKKISANDERVNTAAADVNGDKELTPQDASLILQFVAKKITW